jgi:diguanylate cyclase (GGDEF)-like protein
VDGVLDLLAEAGGQGACWSVFLLEHDRLWAVSHRGYTMIPGGLPLDRGVIGRALDRGGAQYVPDVRADPDYVPSRRGVVSELVLPIVSGSAAVGALNVETTFELPVEAAGRLEAVAAALAGPLAELRRAPAMDLSSLLRLFVHMSSLRDAREIAELAARSLAHVLALEACQVTLADESGSEIVAGWSRSGARDSLPEEVVERLRAHVDHASVVELVDVREAGLSGVAGDCRTLVWLPLRVNDVDVGELVGAALGEVAFSRAQAEAAALLAAQAAASLDAALAIVRERRTAATDPLTGLLNRRGFGDLLEQELERSGDERSPLSLCVLDCDEFKSVNDRGGHERGDRVLLELAELIRAGLAPGEEAARLGGDEFALTLPRTDADGALARADALRTQLAAGLSEAGTPLRVSIGVATYPFDGANGTQLLRAADQGLYAAKASGKDLVVAFRDLGDWARRGAAARARERRARLRPIVAPDAAAQIAAVRGESAPEQVLILLARALTGTLSATATVSSRVLPDGRLLDVARYALRDIDLGTEATYLLDDFPLTKRMLERREPVAMSFLDDSIDRAEAFVLRELGMNSLLMLPIVVAGRAWGLVEVYDVRLREFEPGDVETARALVAASARRLEELAAEGADLDTVGARGDVPLQRPIRGAAPAVERSLRTGESS